MSSVNWSDFTPIDDQQPRAPAVNPGPVDWTQYQPEQPAEPGIVPTIKRTGGQMLTTLATSAEDVIGPNAATRAAHDAGQGIIDRNPAGIRRLADILDSPWLAVRESVGQFAPQIAAAGVGGLAGAKAGRTLGSIAGPAGSAVGAAIGGTVGSLAPIFTQEYGGIRQDQIESGQEDKARALAAAVPATALERIGMGKALQVLKGAGGSSASTVLREVGKGIVKEGATEGAQNVIEQWGAFKDPTTGENLEDTALAAVMGGIGGGVIGGATGVVNSTRRRAQPATEAGGPGATQTETDAASPDALAKPGDVVPASVVTPPDTPAQVMPAGSMGNVGATPEDVNAAVPLDLQSAQAGGSTPSQRMGIDPAAGPLSKVAAQAADLELAPMPEPPGAQDQHAERMDAIGRLAADQQREGRILLADLERSDLPPGVRALRESQLQELADTAPPVQVEQPIDMDAGHVLRNFDARQPTTNPDQALSLAPAEPTVYGNELDYAQVSDPTPMDDRIAAMAAADGQAPGVPLRLNEAHAMRRRAAQLGLPVSVLPHSSGRGYDVQPTLQLSPEQRAGALPEGRAALTFDASLSGRMIAGENGIRPEARSEALALGNAALQERAALEAERQQRTDLGLSNYTPVQPIVNASAQPMQQALAFDNGPTGRMIAGENGLRPERRAEVVNRAQQAAGSEAAAEVPQIVMRADGAPFVTNADALAELRRQRLDGTHTVVPAGGDPSLGFVARLMAPDERHQRWRTNAIQAGRVARGLGIDPKGKRLAEVVSEIDAADAQRAGVAQTVADLSAGQIDQEWSAFAPETGTLGVPRAEMPQVKASHRGALVNFLKARGIDSRADEVPANDLKPTQSEFSQAKVDQARSFQGGDRSILVSSDGYVVDGHHQWLAKRANGEPVKVIRLKAPIQEVLAQVKEFPSSTASDGSTAASGQQSSGASVSVPKTGTASAASPKIVGAHENKAPAATETVAKPKPAEQDNVATPANNRIEDFDETKRGDAGELVLYNTSDETQPTQGLSLEQAQQAVQEALAGLRNPPPIDVVLRAADLGQGIPDYVKGVRKPDGQLAVVAGAHTSPLDVIETVFHELFHHGLRNIVSDSAYVQTMLDLAKRDARVQEYANQWKREAPEATQQREELRNLGFTGSELNGRYEALAIEEGLAVVAEELRAQKQAGTRLGLRVRTLANWLASVADKMGMKRLANSIRNMTYNQAERFVLSAIEHAGDARDSRNASNDVSRFRSRGDTPMGQRVGDALKSMTVTNIKQQAGFKATDLRPLSLQMLGRRQLVDVYGDMLPEMRTYNDLMARMDADKNEAGAGADQLAKDWEKLKDENALADLMHDSTLAQMDPAKDYVQGDNRVRYVQLRKRYEALSPEAQGVYQRARDIHRNHMRDVRAAIKERIERSEMGSERKAAMLKRMDDEFFGHIKGVYFPLARFGQYVVVVKDAEGKVANVSRAETMREADATRSQLAQAFPAAKGFTVGKVHKGKEFVADRDTVGRGFMEQLYGVLDKQGMEPKQRAELEDALGQLYLSSLPDLSWAKHGIHRKGTAGFSQDARRAFAQNVFHGASYLAKLRYGDQLQDQLSEMQRRADEGVTDPNFDSVKAQQVIDEMAKRHDAAMNPKTNAVSTALTSLGFIFYLGLSPASAMVNLSQTALVAYPVMGAKWGFSKSGAALLKASQEAMRGKNDITSSLNPDEKAAFDEAVRSGVVDVTMAHDLAGIAQGEDQKVTNSMRRTMRWASWMFHHAEKFNRQVTFVAAYRLARETGADSKSAYSQAVQATYDGHFDYSANNRPRFMQGNWQKVLLLFKQYSQNMVYTFVRNAQQSLKGATPEVRAEARKALAGLLTSHAMAAGVLGLPMVTTLLAAASMLGSDDDEPWDARVALQNMLADAFGQKPAEVLSHGLSRLTPWDISGRVGLDKLIFPDVQEGLEGQRLGEAAMTAALGPVAAIGVNALKGLQDMSHGQYLRGLESMMPTVLRGPLKAWRYSAEGVKDKSGIVIQDQVDAAALLGQAAGFSPSETRNAFEGKAAVVSHDRALMTRRRALVEQFAMAAMAKDEEGKAEARAAIAKFNDKNPERRILPMQLAQSVRNREKRIREAEDGVYLPRKRRDSQEVGRFANGD